ncbi:S1 RNA-binding domain-containing protein [bacterium]|nr:S1 RNA-binding domain-containing protein [bacterium]
MYLFDKDSYSDKQRQQLQSELKELCNHCSEKEINAITIEREVNNLKFAQYMQKHIGKEFIAQVISVTKYGMYVALENTIEGLVALSNFHDDFYIFNENTFCLVGKNKKNIFTIGNMVKVRCISSSTYTKKIEFELVKKMS